MFPVVAMPSDLPGSVIECKAQVPGNGVTGSGAFLDRPSRTMVTWLMTAPAMGCNPTADTGTIDLMKRATVSAGSASIGSIQYSTTNRAAEGLPVREDDPDLVDPAIWERMAQIRATMKTVEYEPDFDNEPEPLI